MCEILDSCPLSLLEDLQVMQLIFSVCNFCHFSYQMYIYTTKGMVFQICDRAISAALDIPVMPYGSKLMEDPADDKINNNSSSSPTLIKQGLQIILAPAVAACVESAVSNRAEVQRYYGITKFSQVEKSLKWNPFSRLCGPAFIANSSRNFIMSSTSFVITPVLYRTYYPQEEKSTISLFWFGLGVNIFIGNSIAITQQSLWGRSLDYVVANSTAVAAKGESGSIVARNIHYRTVINESLKNEGRAAFFTIPKWAARVLMNAPVQGTLPWFYNEVLPHGEESLLSVSTSLYHSLSSNVNNYSSNNDQPILRRYTKKAQRTGLNDDNKTTATSPISRRAD